MVVENGWVTPEPEKGALYFRAFDDHGCQATWMPESTAAGDWHLGRDIFQCRDMENSKKTEIAFMVGQVMTT